MTMYLVFSFFPKINQAKKIAKLAIKNKLAACVNINKNVNSLYIWKKRIFDENEIELGFKTNAKKVNKLISFLESNHPYECPCIISFPINKVNNKYSNWVNKQTC